MSQVFSRRKTTRQQVVSIVGWHRTVCQKCQPPIGLPETIPLFLSDDVPGTPLALRHAALCLAKRVYRRGSEATQTSASTAQALQRPEAVSWSHPQAPLCRL